MKFRKIPVVIEAIQFNGLDDYLKIVEWAENSIGKAVDEVFGYSTPNMSIQTLEGKHIANPGDWIIKGVKGEFYPCKNDIFKMTYEEVK